VFSEPDSEMLLRAGSTLQIRERYFKLLITDGTKSDGGDRPKPFAHAKIAPRHADSFSQG